jgi:hypothetical protein
LQRNCAGAVPDRIRSGIYLDEVYLKIDGRMVYLWRAVNAEGEVLDVLVQSKRNKRAALKLMRKLLRNRPSFLIDWSRMICGPTARRPSISASNAGMSAGDGRTIGPKIRISRLDGGSARCNASRARAQPRSFSQPTPPPTILSKSNAISRQLNLTACYAPRR